ncbi:hypothetical protein MTO96_036550 [Rhipicephalus appendiculatus]
MPRAYSPPVPNGRPSESEVRRRRAAPRGVVATAAACLRVASPGAWASFKDGGAPVLAGGRRRERTMLSAAAAGRAAAQAAQVHALFMHGGYWWCTCVGCCCCCCCRSVAEVAAPYGGEGTRAIATRAS